MQINLNQVHNSSTYFFLSHQTPICLELFLLVKGVWSVHISLQIRARLFFTWIAFSRAPIIWSKKTPIWLICSLQTHSLSLHMISMDGLEWCGLLLDYCDVFISCSDSHSDGTHSLQRIHWWASDAMLHFSKSVPMKKQTLLNRQNRFIWWADSI